MGICLKEREQEQTLLKNILPSLSGLFDSNTQDKNISRLQAQKYQHRESKGEISDAIYIVYLVHDSENSYNNIKPRSSSTNSNKTIRGRSNMKNLPLPHQHHSDMWGPH